MLQCVKTAFTATARVQTAGGQAPRLCRGTAFQHLFACVLWSAARTPHRGAAQGTSRPPHLDQRLHNRLIGGSAICRDYRVGLAFIRNQVPQGQELP
jgi:hypothetical protein